MDCSQVLFDLASRKLVAHLDEDLARAHAASDGFVIATKMCQGDDPAYLDLGNGARLTQRVEETAGVLQPRQRRLHLAIELARHPTHPGR